MKKSIFIFCFLLFIILSYGQPWKKNSIGKPGSPEANKAMGIEPRDKMGCEFKPIVMESNNYYEVPEKPYFILDNIEELGHIHDGNFGSDYTNEEIKEFTSLLFEAVRYFFGISNNKPQEWQKHKPNINSVK